MKKYSEDELSHCGLPKEVLYELDYEIARADLDYHDNYRGYRFKDNYLFEEYKRRAESGCCGVFETQVILENGDKWIVGCNYGH